MGKGSKRRPSAVPPAVAQANYQRALGDVRVQPCACGSRSMRITYRQGVPEVRCARCGSDIPPTPNPA